MKKRVVITAIGIISPIGNTLKDFVKALKAGRSGVGPITLFDASHFPTSIAAEVKDFRPRHLLEGMKILDTTDDRRVLFANGASVLALGSAGLDAETLSRKRGGVIFGSGIHPLVPPVEMTISQGVIYGSKEKMRAVSQGLQASDRAPLWNRVSLGALSVARQYGIKGPCYTVVSACAASSEAIGQSFRIIQRGEADFIITGGYDSMINAFGVQGFCGLGTMSSHNEDPPAAMKPFDRKRDGFVLGEGAGVLLLEEYQHALTRRAKIYAEIIGYGTSLDAYSVADPHPEGTGAVLAMRRALQDAGIQASAVDYINAHGTATLKNDAIETAAIKKVFGGHAYAIPVSSTKSMIGHQVAAAGALELITTVVAMDNHFIPPTINYQTSDPACDLDYVPNRAREQACTCALSNSFGFGGQNSSLIIKKL